MSENEVKKAFNAIEPEDDGSSNGGFFDMGDDELPDGEIMIGG